MKATKEQIVAEANRRAVAQGYGAQPVEHFIVDVVCENWTPPKPVVDPDVLAWREWAAGKWPLHSGTVLAGQWDNGGMAKAYLAGARMAREREQERAKGLVEYVDRDAHTPHTFTQDRARAVLAKYRGEA